MDLITAKSPGTKTSFGFCKAVGQGVNYGQFMVVKIRAHSRAWLHNEKGSDEDPPGGDGNYFLQGIWAENDEILVHYFYEN